MRSIILAAVAFIAVGAAQSFVEECDLAPDVPWQECLSKADELECEVEDDEECECEQAKMSLSCFTQYCNNPETVKLAEEEANETCSWVTGTDSDEEGDDSTEEEADDSRDEESSPVSQSDDSQEEQGTPTASAAAATETNSARSIVAPIGALFMAVLISIGML